jgi:vacuolar-type H+-ATPase subunit I/STV1
MISTGGPGGPGGIGSGKPPGVSVKPKITGRVSAKSILVKLGKAIMATLDCWDKQISLLNKVFEAFENAPRNREMELKFIRAKLNDINFPQPLSGLTPASQEFPDMLGEILNNTKEIKGHLVEITEQFMQLTESENSLDERMVRLKSLFKQVEEICEKFEKLQGNDVVLSANNRVADRGQNGNKISDLRASLIEMIFNYLEHIDLLGRLLEAIKDSRNDRQNDLFLIRKKLGEILNHSFCVNEEVPSAGSEQSEETVDFLKSALEQNILNITKNIKKVSDILTNLIELRENLRAEITGYKVLLTRRFGRDSGQD